jgi:hypothetical protein
MIEAKDQRRRDGRYKRRIRGGEMGVINEGSEEERWAL